MRSTYAELKNIQVPFEMYEIRYITLNIHRTAISKIIVTSVTKESISFTDEAGHSCVGSVTDFYLTKTKAQMWDMQERGNNYAK